MTLTEPANDNHPDPEVIARREALARQAAPSKDYRRLSERLAKRQSIGGVGAVPANDNQAWPLAQWLRKDGNEVLLRVAERYRAMYDASIIETPLVGAMPDDIFNVKLDQRVHNRADGSVGYKGVRKVKGAVGRFDGDDGTNKVVPISEKVRAAIQSGVSTFPIKPKAPAMRRWQGDNLINAAIDSRKGIRRLQEKLGPLLEPFEDAVLHGETLAAIGAAKGGNTVSSGPIGRAYIMDGLEIVQAELSLMDRKARQA